MKIWCFLWSKISGRGLTLIPRAPNTFLWMNTKTPTVRKRSSAAHFYFENPNVFVVGMTSNPFIDFKEHPWKTCDFHSLYKSVQLFAQRQLSKSTSHLDAAASLINTPQTFTKQIPPQLTDFHGFSSHPPLQLAEFENPRTNCTSCKTNPKLISEIFTLLKLQSFTAITAMPMSSPIFTHEPSFSSLGRPRHLKTKKVNYWPSSTLTS